MDNKTLLAGAGKAAITYPDDFFPYAGFRGRRFIGVHDDIHARVLLLERDSESFLIVSLELGDITNEWAPELAEKTGVPADHIWLTATHDHEAPYANSTWGEFVPDEVKTEPFCRCCVQAILEAFSQARQSLRPARMYCGEGQAWVNVNRDWKYTGHQKEYTAPYISAKNIHGYSDHTVCVVRFDDEAGRTIAFLTGYAVHSSVLFHQVWGDEGGMLISGDLSGAAMRYVEERTDAVAIHLLGAAGDQDPRFSTIHSVFDRDGNVSMADYGDAGYALVDAMAAEWGAEILLASQQAQSIPTDTLYAACHTVIAGTKEKWEGGPPMTMPADYDWKPNGTMDITLYMLRVGGVTLLGIPGELVASVGTELKQLMASGGCEYPMVVTQCNGCVQYMSDAEGYTNKTFEASQSHFAPGIGQTLRAGACQLLTKLQCVTIGGTV